jgi:carbon monoxide dehydrogenase subunit G
MPELSERTRIPAPLAEVWPLLSDPAAVASCIPGAELAPDRGDGLWRGSVKVRFGPTVATFRGEATLDFEHAAHRCTIEGRGIDQRGASRALSSGTVVATAEGEETLLAVDGRFTVTGPLETFANAGGVHVARALLAEFSGNMARLVAERRTPAPEAAGATPPDPAPAAQAAQATPAAPAPSRAPPPPPPTAAPAMSAIRMLWLTLLSWLRSLFRKGSA